MNGQGESYDVAIVGGGVIGCSVAYYLSKEGAKVVVLEKGDIGCEASSAAAGMLTPLAEVEEGGPFQDLAVASLRTFPALAAMLLEETGVDIEYLPSGVLRVAFNEAEEKHLRSIMAEPQLLKLEWLGPDEIHALEPFVSKGVRGALFSPEEHQVNANRLVQAFAQGAARHGAQIKPGWAVTGFSREDQRPTGLQTSQGNVTARNIVLAAGPWTAGLAGMLRLTLPIYPTRGQIVALPGKSVLRHIVWGSEGYLVPKANGLIFAGATVERVGFRKNTTVLAQRNLLHMAETLVPRLSAASVVDCWAGLRPGSTDGMPILGSLPGWEGLFVAAGHFRNGILLAPITGQLLTRSILDGHPNETLGPFSADRFGGFSLH